MRGKERDRDRDRERERETSIRIEMGDYPDFSRYALNTITSTLIRGRLRKILSWKRRRHCEHGEEEIGGMQAQTKKGQLPLEVGRGKDGFSPRACKE